jgi:hypothetical protein
MGATGCSDEHASDWMAGDPKQLSGYQVVRRIMTEVDVTPDDHHAACKMQPLAALDNKPSNAVGRDVCQPDSLPLLATKHRPALFPFDTPTNIESRPILKQRPLCSPLSALPVLDRDHTGMTVFQYGERHDFFQGQIWKWHAA